MQSVPSTMLSHVHGAARTRRFGRIAARIGTDHIHTVGIDMDVIQKNAATTANDPDGLFDKVYRRKAGARVQMRVEDITQHPELAKRAKWVCAHPSCRLQGKRWESKEQLLSQHPDDRSLIENEETHMYFAVVEVPEEHAQPAKFDDKGKEIAPAKPHRRALVMLLSDEM